MSSLPASLPKSSNSIVAFFIRRKRAFLANALAFFGALALVYAFTHFYAFGFVISDSVGASFVLIEKRVPPRPGDLAAFSYSGTPLGMYRSGDLFVKYVSGVPGDVITVVEREVFLNAQSVGFAKTHTKSGVALSPIAAGSIPPGYFYARSNHHDSLDSRYAGSGLVPYTAIVGRARAIF